MKELENKLLAGLNSKDSSLSIEFNSHACNYCTVKEAIERDMYEHADWINEEAKSRAIETGKVWTLQWYPRTPVGFLCIAAPTLGEVIAEYVDNPKPQEA